MENRSLPRGIRNNNPLNIIHSNAHWAGMSIRQTDPNFVQFDSMAFGIRAAVKVLQSYARKNICTVRQIITRWCPDKTAPSYIATVCRLTGMQPETCIDIRNRLQVVSLLDAMIKVECANYEVDKDIITYGYTLAFAK